MIFTHSVKKLIFKSLFLIFVMGQVQGNDTSTPAQENVWLTIAIHGIVNIKPHLSVSNIIRFMRDQITDSVYARAVQIMRNDPFFFQHSAIQELGLKKIDTTCTMPGYAAGAFALSYDSFDKLTTTQIPSKNIFYTFGWSGLLSTQVRYAEAQLLYQALEQTIQEFRQRGINPKIRVIGYSHGGYIALNLGAVFNTMDINTTTWSVDELILLGVPVISDTDFLVNSLLFKKVYHIYSPGDRVQVVDCLATNRFFSHRTFSSRWGFTVPQKLTQIKLRMKRLARIQLAHRRCNHHEDHYPAKLMRNADPGHTELWSFGWSIGYRSYLPLYPFPVGAYLGYIINTLENNAINSNHLTVEFRPFQETMHIKTHDSNIHKQVPFVPKEHHTLLFQQIQPFFPENYSKSAYHAKSQKALSLAREQKKKEWNERKRSHNLRYMSKFRKARLNHHIRA